MDSTSSSGNVSKDINLSRNPKKENLEVLMNFYSLKDKGSIDGLNAYRTSIHEIHYQSSRV